MRLRLEIAAVLLAALTGLSTAEAADSRCADPGDPGPCKALLERYRYDPGSGTCKVFYWGGCGPSNPFETKEDCLQACGDLKPLVIAELKSYPDGLLPYVLLSLEYPKDWAKPEFTVRVNGTERPHRWWGGGSSPDRQYATLLVFPGEAGPARISVQAASGGKNFDATDTLQWNVWSMAGLLDGPGRLEAVLKARPLRFWAFPADGIRVRWNNRPLAPKLEPLSGKPVGLFSIEPKWRAGRNDLSIETTGKDGKRVTREYSFVYLVDGTTRVGETLAIPYGSPGSKSGPFYTIELDGKALVPVGGGEEPYAAIDREGWAVERAALVRKVRAERPGETRVRIFVKRHFLQAVELEREFSVTVVPAAEK